MSKLTWDQYANNAIVYGVDHGVIYPKNSKATVWNGLVSVTEKEDQSNLKTNYFDGEKYIQERSSEGFSASIEAFTYPDQLEDADPFGLSYKTLLYHGYELHLVYNVEIYDNNTDYSTSNDSSSAVLLKWNVSTVPVQIDGVRAASHLVINSNNAYPWVLESFEALLYGSEGADPRMLTPAEVVNHFDTLALFRIIDHGDGTWTAIGPDSWFEMFDATTFKITTPSAYYLDLDTYKVRSW